MAQTDRSPGAARGGKRRAGSPPAERPATSSLGARRAAASGTATTPAPVRPQALAPARRAATPAARATAPRRGLVARLRPPPSPSRPLRPGERETPSAIPIATLFAVVALGGGWLVLGGGDEVAPVASTTEVAGLGPLLESASLGPDTEAVGEQRAAARLARTTTVEGSVLVADPRAAVARSLGGEDVQSIEDLGAAARRKADRLLREVAAGRTLDCADGAGSSTADVHAGTPVRLLGRGGRDLGAATLEGGSLGLDGCTFTFAADVVGRVREVVVGERDAARVGKDLALTLGR